MEASYVVVGAGPSGVVCAETIVKEQPGAKVLLIGNEPEPPYSRMAIPYYLVGNIKEEGTHLRHTDGHYDALGITYKQAKVTGLDPKAHTLELHGGDTVKYEKLCIATGASPIRPPIQGLDNPGVHHCWTLEDARNIISLAHEGAHVVLMGAGFIGCIILEALAERNVNLHVVEMGDRMVPRMLDENAGGLLKTWCQDKGVMVHTSTKITQLEPNKGEPEDTLLVDLDNGHQIPAHLVVVAAGVKSNVSFLEWSGLELDQGIKVNEYLETTAPDVYAAGDVAQGPDFTTGGWSVHAIQPTAADHGRIAALNMLGRGAKYQGSLVMNVLDTLGLISVSYGAWDGVEGGDSVQELDAENYKYIRLEFDGEFLVGAQTLGRTEHVGVLRGLIQSNQPLGEWKDKLLKDPHRIMEAYIATQGKAAVNRATLAVKTAAQAAE
ncbi:MAG: NAD(P)/FAD-dependent oxidoreductase [Magnetovibrionaceae bacterium]